MDINVCQNAISSNDYADYIVRYGGAVKQLLNYYGDRCVNVINGTFAIVHVVRNGNDIEGLKYPYAVYPRLYGLMDVTVSDALGLTDIQNVPDLSLKGRNTIIGMIDTGIDYTNKIFRNENGSTRILEIWDQTINSNSDKQDSSISTDYFDVVNVHFGTVYSKTMIDEALETPNPIALVPTVDSDGHGTFLTGLAAGGLDETNGFSGVAPNSNIVVVKLKEAKNYLRNFYGVPENVPAYEESDIMYALQYLDYMGRKYNMPVSICLGMGSNSGSHTGYGFLEMYSDEIGMNSDRCISVPSGNEANERLHFFGRINANVQTNSEEVEFNVDRGQSGLALELWGKAPNVYSVGLETPRGEKIARIPPRFDNSDVIRFFLENTVIYVDYRLVEEQSGNELILIRLIDPTPGIWKIIVYGEGQADLSYNIWMPISDFVTSNTYFLKPEPDLTITSPGNARIPITVGGYNHNNNAIYIESGRGYTNDQRVKPDVVAPCVNITGPDNRGNYITKSGTSIAAAFSTGCAALLEEWAYSRGENINGQQIKFYFIRGAKRVSGISYPNNQWGYGSINVYNIFSELRNRT